MIKILDYTPLEISEVIDHCIALVHAAIITTSPEARELLLFILAEKVGELHQMQAAIESGEPCEYEYRECVL